MPLLLATAVIVLALSATASLSAQQLSSPIPIIGSFIELALSRNKGIAFSILLPSPWQEFLVIGALCVVCLIAWKAPRSRLLSVAFGLVIGGALANLLDRFLTGTVTDYIAIGSFPVFNLADSAITVGALLLILEAWMTRKQRRESTH